MKRYFYLLNLLFLSLIGTALQGMDTKKVVAIENGKSKVAPQFQKNSINSEEIKSMLKNYDFSNLFKINSSFADKVLFHKCIEMHQHRITFLYEMVEKIQLLKDTENARFIKTDKINKGNIIVSELVDLNSLENEAAHNVQKFQILIDIKSWFNDHSLKQISFNELSAKLKQLRNNQANHSLKKYTDAAINIHLFNNIIKEVKIDLDEPHQVMTAKFYDTHMTKLPDYEIKLDHYFDIVNAIDNCKDNSIKLLRFNQEFENTLGAIKKMHSLFPVAKIKYSFLQKSINEELNKSNIVKIKKETDLLKQGLSSAAIDKLLKKHGVQGQNESDNTTEYFLPGRVQYVYSDKSKANYYADFKIELENDQLTLSRSFQIDEENAIIDYEKEYDFESPRVAKTKISNESSFKQIKNLKHGIIYEDEHQVQVNDRINNMLFTLYKVNNIEK